LAGGVAALGALLAAWAWLLVPQAPPGAVASRWAHESPGPGAFRGVVRSVRLDGVPMPPNGPPPNTGSLLRRLDRGTMTLEVEVVSGVPVAYDAWIYMLQSRWGGVLELSQTRREARVSVPTRGVNWRLGAPGVSLADALPKAAGVPVRLRATAAAGRVSVASSYHGVERAVELGVSPALGWIMFIPFDLAVGERVRWATALVLGLLLLPLGYWAAGTRRPWPAAGSLTLTLVAALAALPAAAGFPPVHWSEWVAGALGATVGWALRGSATYLQTPCASPSDNESSSS
ncbi:MAG: hypothetical protein M3Q93_15305, partial [Gemmatimonadota bacterium]|nr:hypothetical protein [Gemmatimonadota bacterium]